ncbi:MAG: hypothetical protein EKK53_28060 [Burkholderiales bacterium]|nr:MAG: hypothetical protein EKK53_28060 [Burkholderiales bacterium]
MKLRLLALAALLASTGAQALTPAQIVAARGTTLKEITFSGASALRLSFASYMAEICDTTTLHIYFDSASGNNHRAYACNLKVAAGNYAAGTPVVVYKRDQGGSAQGLAPVATNTAIAHMRILDNSSCTVTGTPDFSDIAIPNYICTTTETRVSDAGITDVEPAILNQVPNLADNTAGDPASGTQAAVDTSNLNVASFVQGIFGVVVNKQAYLALQRTQGLDNAGAIDEDVAKRPSLPTNFVRAMLLGGLSASNTTKRGWGLVISETVDPSVNTKAFNICRRQPGSGTQAASNMYFMQNPCSSSAASPLRQASATQPLPVATGTYNVREESGTGGVESCVGVTRDANGNITGGVDSVAGAYGLAVLGRENSPLPNNATPGGNKDKGYRYVRLDGAQPDRYDATTKKGAATGDYDFVYESTLQYNTTNPNLDGDKIAFITSIRTGAPKPSALAAADIDTQQGVMSPQGAWSALGQYPALSNTDRPFASRLSRTAGSCSVQRYVR